MENLHENQEFSSKDVVGVFLSLAILLLVAINAFSHAFHDYKGAGAQKDMAKLSRQLITHGEDFKPNQPNPGELEMRGPASIEPQNVLGSLGLEGKIAKDPWGQAYQYRVFERNSKVYAVVMWSKGPNSKQELTDKHFLKSESGRVFRVLGAGDDLTHIEIIQ